MNLRKSAGLLVAAVLGLVSQASAESFDSYASRRAAVPSVVGDEYVLIVDGGIVKKVRADAIASGDVNLRVDIGNKSVAIGPNTLPFSVDVPNNVAIGDGALLSNTSADTTVAIGVNACGNTTEGRASVCIGFVAGQSHESGASTYIGAFAGRGSNAYYRAGVLTPAFPLIGEASGGLTGQDNECIGEASCIFAAGDFSSNAAVGFNSLFQALDARTNAAYGTASCELLIHGTSNTCIGPNAYHFGTGNYNSFVGSNAGSGVGVAHFVDASPPTPIGGRVLHFSGEGVAWATPGQEFWIPSATISYATITAVDSGANTVTVSNPLHTATVVGTATLTDTTTSTSLKPTASNLPVGTMKWVTTITAGFNVGDSVTSPQFVGTCQVTKVTVNTSVEVSCPTTLAGTVGDFLFDLSRATSNNGFTPAYAVAGVTAIGGKVLQFESVGWAAVGHVVYMPGRMFGGTTIESVDTTNKTVTITTPLYNATGPNTFGYLIANPPTGDSNTGVGTSAFAGIAGQAANNVAMGFNACGGGALTGSGNICIGAITSLADYAASNHMTLGDAIECDGIQSTATAKCGVGALLTAKTPAFVWEVGGTMGLKTANTASSTDVSLCWNATTREVTKGALGCGGSAYVTTAPSGGLGSVGSYAPVELAATNLLLQSNGLATTWTRTLTNVPTQTVSDIAPDGSASAWNLVSTAGNAHIDQAVAISASGSVARVLSAWFDGASTSQIFALRETYSGGTTSQGTATWDNTAQSMTCSSGAVCGHQSRTINGVVWHRVWVATLDANGNNTSISARVYVNGAAGVATSANVFGVQLEAVGALTSICTGTDPRCPSSYIPTTTTQITRPAGISPWALPVPANDPHVVGRIWNNAGVLMASAG